MSRWRCCKRYSVLLLSIIFVNPLLWYCGIAEIFIFDVRMNSQSQLSGNFVRSVQSNFSASRERTLNKGFMSDLLCLLMINMCYICFLQGCNLPRFFNINWVYYIWTFVSYISFWRYEIHEEWFKHGWEWWNNSGSRGIL